MASSEQTAVFTNALYDRMKFIAQILLPALATFVLTVGTLVGWTSATTVAGVITAADAFLGAILRISTNQYYKSGANFDGDVNVLPEDGGNKVVLAFNAPPEDIVDKPGKHSMELKINKR